MLGRGGLGAPHPEGHEDQTGPRGRAQKAVSVLGARTLTPSEGLEGGSMSRTRQAPGGGSQACSDHTGWDPTVPPASPLPSPDSHRPLALTPRGGDQQEGSGGQDGVWRLGSARKGQFPPSSSGWALAGIVQWPAGCSVPCLVSGLVMDFFYKTCARQTLTGKP